MLRDSFLSRSTSCTGSQTVVRFFTLPLSLLCQHMSSIKRQASENKFVWIGTHAACELRANLHGLSADLQRILNAPYANAVTAKRREIVRREVGSRRAELSGLVTGDHEGAPKPRRATSTFLIFWTVRQDGSPVPNECVPTGRITVPSSAYRALLQPLVSLRRSAIRRRVSPLTAGGE